MSSILSTIKLQCPQCSVFFLHYYSPVVQEKTLLVANIQEDPQKFKVYGFHLTTLLPINFNTHIIKSFITFDSMDRTLKSDHSLESC